MTHAVDPPTISEVAIPGRLTYLRPVEPSDNLLLRFLMNDPAVTSTIMGFNLPVSVGDQARWTDSPRRDHDGPWHFTIVERATGLPVGLASTHNVDWRNRTAEHATKIHPDVQRRGLAFDAGMARLSWAFFVVGLRRITSAVLDFNEASQRGLERAGYRLEGRRREAVFKDGRWCDVLLYGLLRSEFEQHPEANEYRRLVVPTPAKSDLTPQA